MYLEHPYWLGYKADKNGSVLGKRGYELSPISHHTGYQVMTVRKRGIQKQLRLHRFIWECHNGIIEDTSLVINHIDGDKHNNSLDNLELVTSSENSIHAYSTGLSFGTLGESNSRSKLTNEDAEVLIRMCVLGHTNSYLGNMFNLHPNYISLVRHRKRWGWLWDELGL